jgi:uncharacterized protein YjbI with pentapeptide repeats
LLRSDFSAADVRNSDFKSADLQDSDLHSANFRQSNFHKASLLAANIGDADLTGADLSESDLTGAVLDNADLGLADFRDAKWNGIRSIKGANLYGVKNAPNGFLEWARHHGAVQETEEQWESTRHGE